MFKANQIREMVRNAIKANFNTLLVGPHGTGKTAMLTEVTRELGLSLKYFSASTLDPFADLVGIPVPTSDAKGRRILAYHQSAAVLDAEVLMFDELNRSHPKVQNAVFELIQFKCINGERLPHLRCVIAAINPSEGGYQVNDLDPALLDRFHMVVPFRPPPDLVWFRNQFGEKLGTALIDWFAADLDEKQRNQVSNRRLEHIGRLVSMQIDPRAALVDGHSFPFHLLENRLGDPGCCLSVADFSKDPGRYCEEVKTNLEVALRFAYLVPTMRPRDKAAVYEILLALPGEALAYLQSKAPFVFKAMREDLRKYRDLAQAELFWTILRERLAAMELEKESKAA